MNNSMNANQLVVRVAISVVGLMLIAGGNASGQTTTAQTTTTAQSAGTAPAFQPASIQPSMTEPSTTGSFFSNLNPANWRMPKINEILPGQDDRTRIRKKKDGLFTDVTDTATRTWDRTKKTFDPRRLNPMNLLPPKPATTNDSPGFFGSLFGAKPAEPQITNTSTVNDFLRQSKPTR